MSNVYQITVLPMSSTIMNEKTGETTKGPSPNWYFFPDEVTEHLTPILARYGYSANPDEFPGTSDFLSRVEFAIRYQFKKTPWVIVFYPQEYPLSGYIPLIRKDPESIKASAYSVMLPGKGSYDPEGTGAPPLSVLWIFSKEALFEAADSMSPAIMGIYESLKTLPEQGTWVHFAEPIDPDWVSEAAKQNDELFFHFVRELQ